MSRVRRFVCALASVLLGCNSALPDEVEEPVPPALVAPTFPEQSRGPVRVVLFGDSNTDCGWRSGAIVACSYISTEAARLNPTAQPSDYQLAGVLRTLSTAGTTYAPVNHGLSGTGTGTGRHYEGGVNARYAWQGITRFEAEVLGLGRPTWNDGAGPARVNAFSPTEHDFVYVSMGTNDLAGFGLGPDETIANLTWMADRWIAAGLPSSHFIITTLPPRAQSPDDIPQINAGIRLLAATKGLSLIDLATFTTASDGTSWRSSSLQIGDGLHYSTSTRRWLAEWIVARIAQAR